MPTEDPKKDPLSGAQTGPQPGYLRPSEQDILDPETERRLREQEAERTAVVGRVRDELTGLCRSLAPAASMGPAWWAQKLSDGTNLRLLSIEAIEQRRRAVILFSRLARLEGHVPVCVLYSRESLSPSDAEALASTSELPKSRHSADPLIRADVGLSGQLQEFGESLQTAEKDGPLRVVLLAEPAKMRYFGVRENPFLGSLRHAGLWSAEGILNALSDLAGPVETGTTALFPFLIQISKECDRRWMLEKNGVLSAAAKSLFDAVGEVDLSAAAAPGAEDLLRIQSVWEVARAEVKGRLEAVIKKLSQEPLETFEEKRDLAAMLMQAIDRWGFRALSPFNQQPAFLRVLRGPSKKGQEGYFQFETRSEDGARKSGRDYKGTFEQLPAFTLVDRPTDRRRKS